MKTFSLSSPLLLIFFLLLQTFNALPQTKSPFLDKLFDFTTGRNLDEIEVKDNKEQDFTSDYIRLLLQGSYYGEWSMNLTSESSCEDPTKFENTKGLAVLNPYNSNRDLVFLDGEYIDKKFVLFLFDFTTAFRNVKAHNGVMKITIQEMTYWKGSDLLRQSDVEVHICNDTEITFTFLNSKTNIPYDPTNDDKSDAIVQLNVNYGDCPFTFQMSPMVVDDDIFNSQIFMYSLLYLVWCLPNIMVSIKKFRDLDNIDLAEGAQYFLVFNINFYLSWWHNSFAEELIGNIGLVIIAIINLFIWSSNFGTSLRSIEGRRNPCLLAGTIFSAIIMRLIFSLSHGTLLVAFIAVPLIDVVKYFKKTGRIFYDMPLYLGILFPSLIVVAYLSLYDHNFARLSPQPQLLHFFTIFMIIAFVVLPIQVEIKRWIRKLQRNKRYINPKNIPAEEMCPICMISLADTRVDSEEHSDAIVEPRDDENPQLNPASVPNKAKKDVSRILKTNCSHMFHEDCLAGWLRIKAECPTCRKPIDDFI